MQSDERRPRVLICDKIADVGIKMLRDVADVDIKMEMSSEELLSIIVDYEAIVVRSKTMVTAQLIDYGRNLKVIGRAGAGLDNIDVTAAQDHDIPVVNSPDANSVAVAEHTLGLMLSLARQLPRADVGLKAGRWEKKQLIGTGLAGKTLGIVGFGRIGREVAARAKAFGMQVLVNQKRPTPELNLEVGVSSVDLSVLLRDSDFISLHVPYRNETHHLIGQNELGQMKPTAFLINTARGGVIDEDALLRSLNEGSIGGAALDVFTTEPAPNSALVQHPRVIATPHIAASTRDAQNAASQMVAQQVIEILQESDIQTVLPLRVVALDKVMPHESIDPRRVERLAKRLESEATLSNPIIVVEVDDSYMVLDGATRTAALKQIGVPHAVVQVMVPDSEELGLRTWYHVIQQISLEKLIKLLADLPELSLVETVPEKAAEELFEYGGLCYLELENGRVYLVQPTPGVNRLTALNKLTETYIAASVVDRTLDTDMVLLKQKYPNMVALVVFQEYTVKQVVQVTQSGRYFPAGITRFIIPGRILRINMPMSLLWEERSLAAKNRWLHENLLERLQAGGIRYYAEPVYLLDE